MLRISKLTDYGVVLCSHLASTSEPRSVRALAEESGIPSPTVSKVLKSLARADLVTATRGASGGYRLARAASEVSVAEIIAALDGPIAVTECTDDSAETSCSHETGCGVRTNWQRINDAVRRALAGISLAEMSATPNSGQLFQIRRLAGDGQTQG